MCGYPTAVASKCAFKVCWENTVERGEERRRREEREERRERLELPVGGTMEFQREGGERERASKAVIAHKRHAVGGGRVVHK